MPASAHARPSAAVRISDGWRRTKVRIRMPSSQNRATGVYCVHTYYYTCYYLLVGWPPHLPGPYTATRHCDWTLGCLRTHRLTTLQHRYAYLPTAEKQASDPISCLAGIVLVASSLPPAPAKPLDSKAAFSAQTTHRPSCCFSATRCSGWAACNTISRRLPAPSAMSHAHGHV